MVEKYMKELDSVTEGSLQSTINSTPSTPSPPSCISSPPTTTLLSSLPLPISFGVVNSSITSNNNSINYVGGANSMTPHESRHLNIVKRFLTTLHQFAKNISSDVGDHVKRLIINLLGKVISFEEFHNSLQEVTHFPLRPFVLPFLKSYLPFLISELETQSKKNGVCLLQYVTSHESSLLDVSIIDASDIFSQDSKNKKRKFECVSTDTPEVSTVSKPSVNGINISMDEDQANLNCILVPPSDMKKSPLVSPSYASTSLSPDSGFPSKENKSAVGVSNSPDSEWKNIHVMLTCILSMVEKTRRALTILQQKEEKNNILASGNTSKASLENQSKCSDGQTYEADVKMKASELVSSAVKAMDEKVLEVKRKAEETVLEVRKAAIAEIQKATSSAETKAQELIVAERCRYEVILRELLLARKNNPDDQKPSDVQICWTCGKKANDTCSGCNFAKYCSPACQHKDWDNHHRICSPMLANQKSNIAKIKSPKMQETPKTD